MVLASACTMGTRVHHALCAIAIVVLWPSRAQTAAPCQSWQTPDANGYCAEFETNIGTAPACNVTVNPANDRATIEAALDAPSNRCICFAAGDYRSIGPLRFTRSGTPEAPIWIRLAGSDTAPPWRLPEAQQAILNQLVLEGVSHLVVHRMSASTGRYDQSAFLLGDFQSPNGCANITFDSCHAWGGACGVGQNCAASVDDIHIQNSYIHENPIINGDGESCGVSISESRRLRIVNCELHDAHNIIQIGPEGSDVDTVIENNDIYTWFYMTDGQGNFQPGTGTHGNEDHIELKAGDPSGNGSYSRIVHNRIWNARLTDRTLSGYDDSIEGNASFFSGTSDKNFYSPMAIRWRYQDNIIHDCYQALGSYWYETTGSNPYHTANLSLIGNIIYKAKIYEPLGVENATGLGISVFEKSNSEVYLNTLIDVERRWLYLWGTDNNLDVRGNVAIQSGQADLTGLGAGGVVDSNVFYGTAESTSESPGKHLSMSLKDRAASTAYNVGDVVRIASSSSCTRASDSGCFLYRVTAAGKSAGTPTSYCTALGCTTTDGSLTVKAIRGPYCYTRKLRTVPEQVCIPYAAVDQSAAEYGFCKGAAVGARPGIGVNDDIAAFDGTTNNTFGTDLEGTPRTGTAGALEYSMPRPTPDAGSDGGGFADGGRNDGGLEAGAGANGGGSDDATTTSPSDAPPGCSCRSARSSCPPPIASFAALALGAAFVTRRRRRLSMMFPLSILLFIPSSSNAADQNGYVAQYECRAGGPRCNVDVAALVAQPCQQTITTADSVDAVNAKLNDSSNVICVQNGDYTSIGTWSITKSGTAGMRKILRSADTSVDPWKQSSNSAATIKQLNFIGASYWVVHGLAFNGGRNNNAILFVGGTSASNNIVSHVFVTNSGMENSGMVEIADGANGNVVQNSVIGDCALQGGSESEGIVISGNNQDNWLVNNEAYNCTKVVYESEGANSPNLVIENNDIYIDPTAYTDCGGQFTPKGNCSIVEYILNFKDASDDAARPVRIVHNRIWGARPGDSSVSGDSSNEGGLLATSVGGAGTTQPYSGADNMLIESNIFFDAQQGMVTTGWNTSVRLDSQSVIGNIVWKMHTYQSFGTHALIWQYRDKDELYLNTIIDSTRTSGGANHSWLVTGDTDTNSDIKCNIVVKSDAQDGSSGVGSQEEYNIYYNSIRTRSSSTLYSVGDIVEPTMANGFLYRVIVAGMSAASAPAYCESLGCIATDSGMKVQAVRGPYTFVRKLKTVAGGEVVVIPYAAVDRSAPECGVCKGAGLGARPGIGVNDDVAAFDGTTNGTFGIDLAGTPRTGTAGALEYSAPKPTPDGGPNDGGSADGGGNNAAVRPNSDDSGGISHATSTSSNDGPAGCSCRSARSSRASPAALFGALALGAAFARRRRRRVPRQSALTVSLFVSMAVGAPACAVSREPSKPAIASVASAVVGGPDLNGYVAQYECRKGNPACDVDVASLTAQPCEQVITASTSPTSDWNAIDWGKNVICIEAGDHSARGRLTVGVSGTSTNRKVLRYFRTGDNDDEPWSQGPNRAVIGALTVQGDHWLVHRIALDAQGGSGNVHIVGKNVILDRVLVESSQVTLLDSGDNADDFTLQNSVVRKNIRLAPGDDPCTVVAAALNWRLVNNEIYDCHGDAFVATNCPNCLPGLVVENNDMYLTSDAYSDGSGHRVKTGDYACAENAVDIKSGGTVNRPQQIIHNRAWGWRPTDGACADGSAGDAMVIHMGNDNDADYVVVKNNVILDVPFGTTVPNQDVNNHADHVSVVGNLLYHINSPLFTSYAFDLWKGDKWEVYLNTVVDAESPYGFDAQHDFQCNEFVSSGAFSGSAGGPEYDHNVYFDTSGIPESHTIVRAVEDRVDSRLYSTDTVVRGGPPSACSKANDPSCFLYRVTVAGTSASRAPAYCTALGCSVTDGTAKLTAIRGPHCFHRKLRTAPEEVCIPYATVDQSAPDHTFCKGFALGSRLGVGVNDDVASFDGTGAGLFGADLAGTPRLGTPGALEYAPPKPKPDAGSDGGGTWDGGSNGAGAKAGADASNGGSDEATPSRQEPAGCSCRSAQRSRTSPAALLAAFALGALFHRSRAKRRA